jgi:hypothetical protein
MRPSLSQREVNFLFAVKIVSTVGIVVLVIDGPYILLDCVRQGGSGHPWWRLPVYLAVAWLTLTLRRFASKVLERVRSEETG